MTMQLGPVTREQRVAALQSALASAKELIVQGGVQVAPLIGDPEGRVLCDQAMQLVNAIDELNRWIDSGPPDQAPAE